MYHVIESKFHTLNQGQYSLTSQQQSCPLNHVTRPHRVEVAPPRRPRWPRGPPCGGAFCLHNVHPELQVLRSGRTFLCSPVCKIQSVWSFRLHTSNSLQQSFQQTETELPELGGSNIQHIGPAAEELVCWPKMTACYEVSNLFPLQFIRSLLAPRPCAQHSVRTHSCTSEGSPLSFVLIRSLAPNRRAPCQALQA